jgi:phage-related protein
VDGIKSLPDKFLQVGSDIVSGLWDGISSGWNWLKDKVSGLAKSLLQGVKDTLNIGSPSKAFRDEVGKWILPGVEVGVEKSLPDALKTMRESATSLISEMQGAVASYNGSFSLSAGALASGRALTGGGTTVYNDNSVEQTNTYNVPTATPSEVAKTQREAVRKLVGGVT